MSRKPKKGYFVKGQFVAEGSELDLELKRELKGTDLASKTDLKRESAELQELGVDLLALGHTLTEDLIKNGHMPELLHEEIESAKRITNFEGKRRQMQYVGKLMRKLDPDQVQAMRQAIEAQHKGSASETLALHLAEQWRDRLIEKDEALDDWMREFPNTDTQQLRALARQARRDDKPSNAEISEGKLSRHGRAYRELFQMVREQIKNQEPSD